MLVLLLLWTVTLAAVPQGPSPAPLALLPDNPCDLLTPAEVSAATGLNVTAARRRPSITQEVTAQREARDPEPGVICTYDTESEFGEIILSIARQQERTADAYWLRRAEYFDAFRPAAVYIRGVGKDAWLSGGTSLAVLIRDNEYFGIMTQMYTPRSRDVVVRLAHAAIEKLAR
jgi:hypothetical protein